MYTGQKGNIWLSKYSAKSDGTKKLGTNYKDEEKVYESGILYIGKVSLSLVLV